MSEEFGFTLLLDAPELTDAQVKGIYDRLSDANLSQRDGRVYIGFDREAPTFAEAAVSAILDLEQVLPEIAVLELEPEELVFMADIATRRGRSKESVSLLVEGRRGPGGFPAGAVGGAGVGRVRWGGAGRVEPVEEEELLGVLEGGLQARVAVEAARIGEPGDHRDRHERDAIVEHPAGVDLEIPDDCVVVSDPSDAAGAAAVISFVVEAIGRRSSASIKWSWRPSLVPK